MKQGERHQHGWQEERLHEGGVGPEMRSRMGAIQHVIGGKQ